VRAKITPKQFRVAKLRPTQGKCNIDVVRKLKTIARANGVLIN
jgi:hypothetical protein